MNATYFILTALIATATAAVIEQPKEQVRQLKGMQELSFTCSTYEQQLFIKSSLDNPNLDFLRVSRLLGERINVLVAAEELESFKNALSNQNIPYVVTVADVEQAVQAEKELNIILRNEAFGRAVQSPFKYYPRYEEMVEYLKQLSVDYSNVASLIEFGESYEGRTLYALKISSGGKNKPMIFMDAGIHAREWIAPTTALYTIHQLVTNQSNVELYKNVDWLIIPSINPDGYEYTHTDYRFWRKTRSPNPSSTCYGTDANRNFGYQWMTVGASDNPCSDTYAGAKPFSEPETTALKNLILAQNGTVKAYLTLHSFGQYMLHPWGYTSDVPENEPELVSVGTKAAKALAAKFGTHYTVGSSTNVLYAAAGGSDDWAMAVGGAILSFTVELPGNFFDPPTSAIEPVGLETFEAFRVFQAHVEENYLKSDYSKKQ